MCMNRPRHHEAGPEEFPGSCIKLSWEPSQCPYVLRDRDGLTSADLLWQQPRGRYSDVRAFEQLLGLGTAKKSTGKPRWTAPRPPVAALAPGPSQEVHWVLGAVGSETWLHGQKRGTESVRRPTGSAMLPQRPLAQPVCGGASPKQDGFIMTEHETIHIRSASPPPQAPHLRIIVREPSTRGTNVGLGSSPGFTTY